LPYNAIALTTRSVTVTDITAAAMRLVVVKFIAVSSVGGYGYRSNDRTICRMPLQVFGRALKSSDGP
jgi:hypothetical protein